MVDVEKPFKRKVAVLKDVLDADVYISLPKMKTHGLTMLSGAVKNNFGLAGRRAKVLVSLLFGKTGGLCRDIDRDVPAPAAGSGHHGRNPRHGGVWTLFAGDPPGEQGAGRRRCRCAGYGAGPHGRDSGRMRCPTCASPGIWESDRPIWMRSRLKAILRPLRDSIGPSSHRNRLTVTCPASGEERPAGHFMPIG